LGDKSSLPGLMFESAMFIGNVQTEMNLLEKSLNHGCRSVLVTSTVDQKGTARMNMGHNSDPSVGNTVGTGGVSLGGTSSPSGTTSGSFKPHILIYERIRDLREDLADADESTGLGRSGLFLCHRFRNLPAVKAGARQTMQQPVAASPNRPLSPPVIKEGVVSIASLVREQKQKLADLRPEVSAVGSNAAPPASTTEAWADENSVVRGVLVEYDQIRSALGRSTRLAVVTVPCFMPQSHVQDSHRWVQKVQELSKGYLPDALLVDADLCIYLENCRTLHRYMNEGLEGAPVSLGLDISTELLHAVSSARPLGSGEAGDEWDSCFESIVNYLYRELSMINNASTSSANASRGEAGREGGTVIGVGVPTFAFCAVNPFTVANAYTRKAVVQNDARVSHRRYVWTETLRSHERKPGLLVNTDMAGINNRSVYGAAGGSDTAAGASVDLLGGLPVELQREQREIDAMIAECIEELQAGWKSCFKLEQIYNDKSQEKDKNGKVFTNWLYGHVLAATQHSILYPEEWLYIFSTSVDPTVSHHLKQIKDGLVVNDAHNLRDWMTLYTPLVKQFFSVYERFLHARKRSILFDLKTANSAACDSAISFLNNSGVSGASPLEKTSPLSTMLLRLMQESGRDGAAAFVTVGDTEAAANTFEAQWRRKVSDPPPEDENPLEVVESQELLLLLLTGMQAKLTTIHAGVCAPGTGVLTTKNAPKA
jgi:hypothetical protein